MSRRPIAVYHEHPDWFRPLFAELDKRGIPFDRLDAAAHTFDPTEASTPWSLVFNRASPSAYLRGHAQTTFYTLHWLRHLERLGVPVVNGAHAYANELSKATQADVLRGLGLPSPRTRVINHPARALAAEQLPQLDAGLGHQESAARVSYAAAQMDSSQRRQGFRA